MPFRGSEAIAAGLVTRGQLRSRAWTRLLPDVYIASNVEPDHRLWCAAACVAVRGRGGVSGRNALRVLGFPLFNRWTDAAPIQVTISQAARLYRHPRLDVRRSTLHSGDLITEVGIRTTSPLRTAFDLGRELEFVEAVIAVDAMLAKASIAIGDLEAYAGTRTRWPGLRGLRAVIAAAEPRTESPMETRLRLVIVAGGLPRPVAQFRVLDATGRFAGRVDLAYPDRKLAIEYDGDQHRDPAAFRSDMRRLNRLRLAGWTVLRFASTDVFNYPDRIIADITSVLRS